MKESPTNKIDDKQKNNVCSLNNNIDNPTFQLDTGADLHVSGNKLDFSSHDSTVQSVRVAGGGHVTSIGCGNLILSSIDNKTEVLNGAIHIPGQKHCILSSAQLEKQGYFLRWPSGYRDEEPIRSDGTICAMFSRTSGRLMFIPKSSTSNNLESPHAYSVQRGWHNILGHPGQKTQ